MTFFWGGGVYRESVMMTRLKRYREIMLINDYVNNYKLFPYKFHLMNILSLISFKQCFWLYYNESLKLLIMLRHSKHEINLSSNQNLQVLDKRLLTMWNLLLRVHSSKVTKLQQVLAWGWELLQDLLKLDVQLRLGRDEVSEIASLDYSSSLPMLNSHEIQSPMINICLSILAPPHHFPTLC